MRGSDSLKMLSLKRTIEDLGDDELREVYKICKKRKKKIEQNKNDMIFRKKNFEDLPERFKYDLEKCYNFKTKIRSKCIFSFHYEDIYINILKETHFFIDYKYSWHVYFVKDFETLKCVDVSNTVNMNDASTPCEYIAFFITIKLKRLYN